MLSICATTLKESLKLIKKTVTIRNSGSISLKLSQKLLEMTGKNSSAMTASIPMTGESEEDGFNVAVNLSELLGALDCFPKNHTVSLLCENEFFHIKGLNGESTLKYSVVDEEDGDNKAESCEQFSIPAGVFIENVLNTAYAASKDPVKDCLTAVYFSLKDSVTSTSTDGHRLMETVNSCQWSTSCSPDVDFIIEASSATSIAKFLKGKDCPQDVKISLRGDEKGVTLYFDKNGVNYRYSQFKYKGTYPFYQQLIPETFAITAEFSGSDFLSAVERAAKVSDKVTNVVRIALLPEGGMSIEVKREGFNYSECIDCEYSGEDFLIAFNHRYLTEFLKMPIVKGKRITIKANSPTSPVILAPSDSSTWRYLVMPVQIRNFA